MAVVVDESYYASDSVATSLVLATVVDVLTSNVPQDDCSFEDLFQLSYVIDRDAGFRRLSLFPLLDLLSPCGCVPGLSKRPQSAPQLSGTHSCGHHLLTGLGWQDLDPQRGRGRRQLRCWGRCSDRTHCRFQSIPQGLCSERPRRSPGPSFAQPGLDQTCLQEPNHQLSPGET